MGAYAPTPLINDTLYELRLKEVFIEAYPKRYEKRRETPFTGVDL